MRRMNRRVNKEKPPRRNPGGRKSADRSVSAFDRVAAFPVGALGRGDGEAHLLAQDPGQEPADRMGLPAGGLPKFLPAGPARPPQQVENLGGLGAMAGPGGLFARLRRHAGWVGLPGGGGLLPRPRRGRRNVAPVCANVGLFVGNGRLRRGRCCHIRRLFCNCVHDDSFFCGDYRDHRDHSAGRRKQANSHRKWRRHGDEFGGAVPMAAGSGR